MEKNNITQEILEKEFEVNFKNPQTETNFTIARVDYESMPCAMKAYDWTDEQMTELAVAIARELGDYNFDTSSDYYEDEVDDAFWKEMECCAVHLGMQYYEDIE